MADRGPSRLLLLLVLLIILAASVGAAAAVNYLLTPRPPAAPLSVAVGDNVTVNYIGEFGSGAQIGKVFDTSIYSVYQNNASYPKSLYFPSTHNATPSAYHPLGVHVGASGSGTVGNLSFSTVVTGFWQGMLGMTGNSTRWISMPYNLAYGPLHPSCLRTEPLATSTPTLVLVAASDFAARYPGASATAGAVFTDPTYGWTDTVLSVNASTVVVENLPSVGQTVRPFGWNVTVTNVSASSISLTNDITPSNYGTILGTGYGANLCSSSHFLISSVDPVNGTFTENYNSEVTGETLVFRVTVLDIFV